MAARAEAINRRPATKRQAWKDIETHYRKIKDLHLGQLFADDPKRGERLAILRAANIGNQAAAAADAENTPLRDPEHYQYDLNLRDIAEVWRRGSVIASWLLDLTANALIQDPELSKFERRVSDSGEGRWTIKAANRAAAEAVAA